MTFERRRSNRLMLTIPLRVRGSDENGEAFECDAQTIDISRHGARIRIARTLAGGQQVTLINLANRREAPFRVAGPLAPMTKQGGEFGVMGPLAHGAETEDEWGMESLDTNANLWGIRFPPPTQDSEPKALLACRECGGAELVRLTLVEVDVLETSGIIRHFCPACGHATPWGYAESEIVAEAARQPWGEPPPPIERRRHRRAVLQIPIQVRDYFGGLEIAKSENVSKGGVCFTSEKSYQLGEGIMVACPYDKNSPNLEVPAQIIVRQEVPRSHRRIYRARYKAR